MRPVCELSLAITVDTRTGDTSAETRILIFKPGSVSLLIRP